MALEVASAPGPSLAASGAPGFSASVRDRSGDPFGLVPIGEWKEGDIFRPTDIAPLVRGVLLKNT